MARSRSSSASTSPGSRGRSAEDLEDEDILREVLNTVGKPGRLGADIRCVVSVSMLTEGWHANTVTHVLGIRAFGTQLLCEQVVGRALRRASYDPTPEGMFEPEYAEVYGVPFTFLSSTASGKVKAPKPVLTVRALPERSDLLIEFPRVMGYRFEMPTERLTAKFDVSSVLELSTRVVPTQTELDPIVGEINLHDLPLDQQRLNTVVFAVAKRTLDTFFRDDDNGERPLSSSVTPQRKRFGSPTCWSCAGSPSIRWPARRRRSSAA